ncbi:MAG: 1-(5-phosphoribosyl)-5-[(5-phosphoribosylamino)methylideneamino]imidazole-4-carboxamide isomerase [Candidatus Brocadiia bacterium]
MLVYPAVDIARGRCVRLLQGRPEDETVYWESPADAARHWQDAGAQALHVVDLDGALARDSNPGPVQEILDALTIPVEVAGGLRDTEAVRRVLDAGAARAVVGTMAVRDPDWAVELCRELPDRVVIAVDAREGRVAVEGWQELAEVGPVELAQRLAEGRPAAFLYTDVARDGMLTRPHFEGVEELLSAVDVPVIASGGVASVDDVRRLGECGADAVVIGKALYEGMIELPEAIEAASEFPSRLRPAPEG